MEKNNGGGSQEDLSKEIVFSLRYKGYTQTEQKYLPSSWLGKELDAFSELAEEFKESKVGSRERHKVRPERHLGSHKCR